MVRTLLPVFALLACLLAAFPARADVWPVFRSESKMYHVEFPSKPEIVHSAMRVAPDLVIHSEQMSLKTNAGPESTAAKTQALYLIRLDQSFGAPLERREALPGEIEETSKQYINSYTAKGGKVTKFEDYARDGFSGKTLWIEIASPSGVQVVRINLFMSSRTKIQQITICPKDIAEHYTISQFFHSLRLFRGEPATTGDIEKEWIQHKLDEKGLFTVRLPASAPPLLTIPPKVESIKTHTHIDALFLDAVRNETLLFKAHLYDYGNTKIDEGIFDLFLRKYHFPLPDKALIAPLQLQDFKGVSAIIPFRFSEKEPWLQEKKVKAYFVNNYFGKSLMLVLEISGSRKNIEEGDFANRLMNTLVINGKPALEIRSSGEGGPIVPPAGMGLKY